MSSRASSSSALPTPCRQSSRSGSASRLSHSVRKSSGAARSWAIRVVSRSRSPIRPRIARRPCRRSPPASSSATASCRSSSGCRSRNGRRIQRESILAPIGVQVRSSRPWIPSRRSVPCPPPSSIARVVASTPTIQSIRCGRRVCRAFSRARLVRSRYPKIAPAAAIEAGRPSQPAVCRARAPRWPSSRSRQPSCCHSARSTIVSRPTGSGGSASGPSARHSARPSRASSASSVSTASVSATRNSPVETST